MKYRVDLAHEVEKLLDRMDRPTERRIRARFDQLAGDPFDPQLSAPLTDGAGVRKSRAGGWRNLFTVDRNAQVLSIATVDTRGQVLQALLSSHGLMVERTRMTHGGRIVIPAAYRKALGVEIGDEVLLRLEGKTVRVYTRAGALKRAQQVVRKYVPKGVSLAEELLRERRCDAHDE